MIHVAYGLYDKDGRYSKFTGTSMLSLFENTTAPPHSVIVHILHDNTLSQENRDKFIYIAGRYGQIVKFYNVEELCKDKIEEIKNFFPAVADSAVTIGTFYRFLIIDVLDSDIEKVIYLDSDIIVNLDINELWQVDLQDKYLASSAEKEVDYFGYIIIPPRHYLVQEKFVKPEDYFVAGLLVMNLKKLRNASEIIKNGMNFYVNHPQCKYFDQDILNYCFANDYIHLPKKFGAFVNVERTTRKNMPVQKMMYHYAGIHLTLDSNDKLNFLWLKYFVKTPFFNENTIGNLYGGIQQLYIQQKNFARQVSTLMSGKTRAFFVQANSAEAIKKIFHVKPEEEFIIADTQDSVQNLTNAMKLSNGQKVFFIFVSNFYSMYNLLIQEGFAPGKDFVNAAEFLSDAEGVPLFIAHSFVKIL